MDEAIRAMVTEATSAQVFAVWFLIGAALVFWMQAGFAMVEAGFTRAKNTGKIAMKQKLGMFNKVHKTRMAHFSRQWNLTAAFAGF